MEKEQELKVKEFLGSDYEAYLEFKKRQAAKELQKKAREVATTMVSENGKYAGQWGKLNAQLDAIWDKAMAEANAQVGIVVEPKKEE